MLPVFVVFTTCANSEDAERLGRRLVDERLAACATALPGATSIYHWKGETKQESETLLLLKTTGRALSALETRLLELHPYETPEFVAVSADQVAEPYRAWVAGAVVAPIQPA